MVEGTIVKSLSGFYTVTSDEGIFICKGRGVFRNQKITPLVGDEILFNKIDDNTGYIIEIKQRENELIRPPIANVSQAVVVMSAIEPAFSHLLLDRFLISLESEKIKPLIVITKMDLIEAQLMDEIYTYQQQYEAIGYDVELVSLKDEQWMPFLKEYFKKEITVLTGQSGVGKSTMLNRINPDLAIKTGEISSSLGRGKHTTRHVELIEINGGYVADTPGFSSLEFTKIESEQLSQYFREMKELTPYCKFRGCLHDKEPKCAVKKAVEDGEILSSRYKNYLTFLQEIQSRKPRY